MQPYDLLMIFVLLAATWWGARKGLAWQVASILSLLVSYLASLKFSDAIWRLLSRPSRLEPFRRDARDFFGRVAGRVDGVSDGLELHRPHQAARVRPPDRGDRRAGQGRPFVRA